MRTRRRALRRLSSAVSTAHRVEVEAVLEAADFADRQGQEVEDEGALVVAAVTVASGGLGLGNDGLLVIDCTICLAMRMSAGIGRGSFVFVRV